MRAFDEAGLRAVNDLPDAFGPLFLALSEATKHDVGRILLGLLALGLLIWPKTRTATVIALCAWPIANGFTEAFKYAGMMPRPSWPQGILVDSGLPREWTAALFPEPELRVGTLTSYGTASSHSGNMMAVAFAYFMRHKRLGAVWIAVAILTGMSRLYVGVHYPSQLLFGWLCGAWCGFAADATWRAISQVWAARTKGRLESRGAAG